MLVCPGGASSTCCAMMSMLLIFVWRSIYKITPAFTLQPPHLLLAPFRRYVQVLCHRSRRRRHPFRWRLCSGPYYQYSVRLFPTLSLVTRHLNSTSTTGIVVCQPLLITWTGGTGKSKIHSPHLPCLIAPSSLLLGLSYLFQSCRHPYQFPTLTIFVEVR